MTHAGVLKRVKEDPELTATLHESRESLVDEAQTKLGEAVREGSAWAVKFVLETWGKSRGFTKQLEVAEQSTTKLQVVIYLPDNGRRRAIS